MNFASKDRFFLHLLIYRKVGQNSIFNFILLKGMIFTISKLLAN